MNSQLDLGYVIGMTTEQPIIDYKVIVTMSGQKLEREVKDFLDKGYQPFGPPHMTSNSDGTLTWSHFHQVMVKHEKPDEQQFVEMLRPGHIFLNGK